MSDFDRYSVDWAIVIAFAVILLGMLYAEILP